MRSTRGQLTGATRRVWHAGWAWVFLSAEISEQNEIAEFSSIGPEDRGAPLRGVVVEYQWTGPAPQAKLLCDLISL
jgi:hypothetical protein